jgi:hypothetical protein
LAVLAPFASGSADIFEISTRDHSRQLSGNGWRIYRAATDTASAPTFSPPDAAIDKAVIA